MRELVTRYHRDFGSPRCTIKVDLMKAYDSVDWGFLIDTVSAMGIQGIFVQWITQCISTACYSVVINGSLEGGFPLERGASGKGTLYTLPFLFGYEEGNVLATFE